MSDRPSDQSSYRNLRDQHVIVTGGSSGIGKAIAMRAAAASARVSLIARDPARLAAAQAEISAAAPGAPPVFAVAADVAEKTAVQAADVLVTSAGVARPGYFEELPLEVFERAMAVNYFGTLFPIKALVPGMRARGRGAIVIISSGAGLHGFFGYTAYAPSKFAVRGLAESLRAELLPAGVRVVVVYPPDTDTPQLAEENRTKPAETRAITAHGGLWTADAVARVTLDGLARNKFAITPGGPVTALAWLHSLLAPFLRWRFDRAAARARKRAGR